MDAIDVVVNEMVFLPGHFVDTVYIDRPDGMGLIHGQVLRAPVDLARAGEHNLNGGVIVAAGFKDGQLGMRVDLQVSVGVLHRVNVAGLTGEIEEIILPLNEVAHRIPVAHVRDVDAHLILHRLDIPQVAAVLRH